MRPHPILAEPITVLLALVVGLVACSAPPPPPAPAPSDTSAEAACSTIARLRCPEATLTGPSCPAVIRRAEELRDMHLPCVAGARTVDELRACGSVRCIE